MKGTCGNSEGRVLRQQDQGATKSSQKVQRTGALVEQVGALFEDLSLHATDTFISIYR